MSSTKPGFYTNPLLVVNDGNAFENVFTITPSLSNSNSTINYDITSNRPGITIGYNVVDIDSNYFTSATTGNVTLDGNGNGTVSLNANIGHNYANTNPVSFTFNLSSQYHRSSILAENNNVTLVQPTQISATGGTVTETDSGNGFVYAGYKVHSFTSNANLSISNLGGDSSIDINTLIVGGGGGGGQSYSRNTVFFGAYQSWDRRSGSGGGGGGANTTSISISGLSTTNYPVIIGAGGTTGYSGSAVYANPGSASSVFGLTGGGGGRTLLVSKITGNGSGVPSGSYTTRAGKSGSPQDNLGGYAFSYEQNVGTTRATTYAGGGGSPFAEGGNASNSGNGPGGNGSNGVNSEITGANVYYGGAGGAGGVWTDTSSEGSGGLGGGGDGSIGTQFYAVEGNPATSYGGGGGGAGASGLDTSTLPVDDKKGGAGYQGVVILRYLHKYKKFNIT